MRSRTKFALALAGLALGGVLLEEARAGNWAVTSASTADVELWSVEVDLASYFTYGGTEPDVAIVVDDVTYSVELDPCCAEAECLLFTPQDLMQGPYDAPPGASHSTSTNLDDWISISSNVYGHYARRYAFARGTSFSAALTNGAAAALGPAFDIVSHQLYAETIGRERATGWVAPEDALLPEIEPAEMSSVGTSVALAIAIASTSESRHFQTPEMFSVGPNPPTTATQGINFHNYGSRFTNSCPYRSAKACIKGRLLRNGAVPTRFWNFTGSSL